jgi:hypothetical protein
MKNFNDYLWLTVRGRRPSNISLPPFIARLDKQAFYHSKALGNDSHSITVQTQQP